MKTKRIACAAVGVSTLLAAALMVDRVPWAAGNMFSFANVAASLVDYRATPFKAKAACSALATVLGATVKINSHDVIPAKDGVPEHCRINGVIPAEVGFQVNLPVAWNGRLYMYGNGGYAGEAAEAPNEQKSRDAALRNGFATARTDTGHLAEKEPLATFAVDAGKVVDHGHRAVHETVLAAKKLVDAFYGKAPDFSYWDGCSTGGRQGMMAAQRYPDDFDGIVAAAPTLDWTNIMIKGLWNEAALDGAGFTVAKMNFIGRAVIAKCDAKDGLKDGLIDDPAKCDFDPARDLPKCAAGDGADCVTERQIQALQRIYKGPHTPDGKALFVPQVPGSEPESTVAPFVLMLDGQVNRLTFFADSWMKYLVFGDPNYDARKFDFDRDLARTGKVDPIFNPTTDLAAFKARGGKIVTFWGWADNALNPQMGTRYYDAVAAKMGLAETQAFYRLFLVPGVAHCRGGYGPSEIDAMTSVINWVEKGVVPERLAARLTQGPVKYNRAYCAYPLVTRYKGTGDPENPESFSCVQP